MSIVDEISPTYVGSRILVLQLADALANLRSFSPVEISVDYAAADELGGAVLPLEQIVTGPSASSFVRRIHRRTAPSQISFTPQEGGRHTVLLREIGHNRVYGTLSLDIAGSINDPNATQGGST